MYEVPTLLVGLGGIGSFVVDQVYGQIPPERRSRIAVHAFDTNINDISRLRHLRNRVTQTSTNWTVGQYILNSDPTIQDWFPHQNKELKRKLLTDGAGQIRVVSRLAYRAAMEQGKLGTLQQQIARVFRATGQDAVSSVRIMIVTSLAGGTGSGIFIQAALFLREMLDRTFGKQNVLVRGAFLLPDTLISSGVLDKMEHENVRANAYACLKELDAITQNTGVTIELEYRPGQTDMSGRPSLVIGDEHLPYNFAFMYDFENTAGENLGNFTNYLNQAIKSVYLSLFTPLAAQNFSVEDNQILSLIERDGRSRYCGAGVASLVYPYQDIVEYSALRWATDNLSDQWLRLDDDYQQEFLQYERDIRAGVNRVKPELKNRYIRLLDDYAADERPAPFFKAIYRSTRLQDKKGRPTTPKINRFLESIEQEIEKRVTQDAEVMQLAELCTLDEVQLKNRDRAQKHVLDVEEALFALRDGIYKAIDENKVFLVNQIMMRDHDEPGGVGGQDYRINSWMLSREEPIHPVGVRYMLYQFLNLLDEKLLALKPENERLRKSIERYQESYDDPDTEDYVETPEDILRSAREQSVFSRVLKNQFKDFAEEYQDKASRQLRNLRTYHKERMTELVFIEIRHAIADMLKDWERYFQNLRDVRNRLLEDVNRRLEEHTAKGDPTQRFVLASPQDKKEIWDQVRLQLAGSDLPATGLPGSIARQIYLGQYHRFCIRRLEGQTDDEAPESTEAMFRKDVLGWCRTELGKIDALNLNIFQALRTEAQRQNQSPEAHIEDGLKRLTNLAKPLVPQIPEGAMMRYWGVHPEALSELHEGQQKDWLISGIVEDSAFSPYELIRYRANYGLTAEDFPKFSVGSNDLTASGVYFRAYQSRVRKLTGQSNVSSVTPHLDKRWHLPAYLPDINQSQVLEDQARVDQAFLRGLAHGYFKAVHEDGTYIWTFHSHSGPQLVRVHGNPVGAEVYRLHQALLYNPAIVDQTLEQSDRDRTDDRDRYPIKKATTLSHHGFYNGVNDVPGAPGKDARNILDVVLGYALDTPDDAELPRMGLNLLSGLLDELETFYLYVYGSHQKNTARQGVGRLIERLRKSSQIYQSADKDSAMRARWDGILDQKLKQLK